MNKLKRVKRRFSVLEMLSKALKEEMSKEGVNITQMADDIGVARNQLYLIAEGSSKHKPKISTLEKIAAYLGLEIVVQNMS